MEEEKVKIHIGTDGKTTITVNGVKGSSCKDLTADFERGLGVKVSDTDTKELFEQEPARVQNRG